MENASCSALKLRKEVLWKQFDATIYGGGHERLLAVGWNKASRSTSRFGIGPAPDAEDAAAGHLSNRFDSAANSDNVVSRLHHGPNDAIIAPLVNPKYCDIRHYSLVAKSATFCIMSDAPTQIDRHWLRDRLKARGRGAQARLAEHLGLQSNVMSKIMNGTRSLQQDEIPKVLAFFNARIVLDDETSEDLSQILRDAGRLNTEGLQLLRTQLNGMLRTPSLLQPPESTEQES